MSIIQATIRNRISAFSFVHLLHLNGADGSSSYDDVSGSTWQPIRAGFPNLITTTWSKFGGASLDARPAIGGVQGIMTPYDASKRIDQGDFTVEGWARCTDCPDGAIRTILSVAGNDSGIRLAFVGGPSGFALQLLWNNVFLCEGGATLAINTWYYVAACRSGSNMRIYVDGTQAGSTGTGAGNLSLAGRNLCLGGNADAGNGPTFVSSYVGQLDEWRVSKTALYTGTTITVPSAEFPNT